jgi:hypothetical protein
MDVPTKLSKEVSAYDTVQTSHTKHAAMKDAPKIPSKEVSAGHMVVYVTMGMEQIGLWNLAARRRYPPTKLRKESNRANPLHRTTPSKISSCAPKNSKISWSMQSYNRKYENLRMR